MSTLTVAVAVAVSIIDDDRRQPLPCASLLSAGRALDAQLRKRAERTSPAARPLARRRSWACGGPGAFQFLAAPKTVREQRELCALVGGAQSSAGQARGGRLGGWEPSPSAPAREASACRSYCLLLRVG